MAFNWQKAVDMIYQFITECIAANAGDEQIIAAFRNPRPLQVLRMERAIRIDNGMSLREWRVKGNQLMAEFWAERDSMTDEMILEMVNDVRQDGSV